MLKQRLLNLDYTQISSALIKSQSVFFEGECSPC